MGHSPDDPEWKACLEEIHEVHDNSTDKRAAYLRWFRYGLTPSAYDAMLRGQEGRCAICKRVPKRFCVDHDHKTGNVRGLLCHGCNVCLGWYETNVAVIQPYIR